MYYTRANGSSTLLYTTPDIRGSYARSANTAYLCRVGEPVVSAAGAVVVYTPSAAAAAAAAVQPVSESAIRYLYVVRNCDLPSSIRELKIGITSSIPATLRTYHRRNPNDQAIIVVDCEQSGARSLERELQRELAVYRVDASEVFEVRAHEVTRCLRRRGLVAGADGIFRRR